MRASSELQFGALREVWRHARGREYCRGKPDSVRTRVGEGGGQLDRRQARDEPLCARIKGANQEISEGKTDV